MNLLAIAAPMSTQDMLAMTELYPKGTDDFCAAMRVDSLEPEYRAFQEGSRDVLLGLLGSQLVGAVQVVWDHASIPDEILPPGAAMIHHLRVHPHHRSRGIGHRLMVEAEHRARGHRFNVVTLGVEPDNDAALAFYTRRGYVAFTEYTGDSGERIIGLRKDLTAPT